MGFLRALPLSYLRLRKGQVSILRPRANNAMKYLLCETIFAPSGNRNRGTSLEGKYVTTTPKVLVENGGIDPPASRMQSERSTI